MSTDRSFPDDADDPGLGFQAGFGFYLGLVVTGFVAIAGVFADVSTGSLLGVLPSTLTGVTIAGHILAKRARGLPERIGSSLRRRLASYAPSAAFALISFVLGPMTGAVSLTARLTFITIVFVLLTAVSAFGVNRICRKRYVEAITGDEPTVRWTATRSFSVFGGNGTLLFGVMMIAGGLAFASMGNWFSLFWVLYGAAFLLGNRFGDRLEDRFDWYDSGEGEGWNQESAVAAYDVGLVVDDRKLVPWDAIGDVRLTDDELVVEREDSRFDLRYERSDIDDPQTVLERIERARAGVDAPARERPDLRERDAVDREGESAGLESDGESKTDTETGTETESKTETETDSTDLETA